MTTTKTDRQPAWVLEARRLRDEHTKRYQERWEQDRVESRGAYIADLMTTVQKLTGLMPEDLALIHGGGFYHDVMIRADGYHFVKPARGAGLLDVVECCTACGRWNSRGSIRLQQFSGEQKPEEHESELEDFAAIIDSTAPDHECGHLEGDTNYAIPLLPTARELPLRRIRPHEQALLDALATFVIREGPEASI